MLVASIFKAALIAVLSALLFGCSFQIKIDNARKPGPEPTLAPDVEVQEAAPRELPSVMKVPAK